MATRISRTPLELRPVERDLLNQTGGAHVEWCGRGATALYWAFRVARRLRSDLDAPEVVLPSICCATPANAALLAGCRPRFADVNARTGMPDVDQLLHRVTGNVCALVFVHLYGQTAALDDLARHCRERGVLLIEDAAQALGANLPGGAAVGSAGDCGVYSFNPTKILECGGGALLLRNAEHSDVLDEVVHAAPLEEPEADALASLGVSYRNLHHALVALLRGGADAREISPAFMRLQPHYDPLYLRPMHSPWRLADAWRSLPSILDRRRAKASLYAELLAGGPWGTLDGWRESGVCWRYTLLSASPQRIQTLSERVRRDGFHVSNLYWPVSHFFNPSDACPNAERFARSVLNLWVDESVDEDYVRRCAMSLKERARESESVESSP